MPTNMVATNKPGGGSATGVGYVMALKNKDPHTLVLISPQTLITPLRVAGTFGVKNLTPIMNFMLDDYLLAVKVSSPYQSINEVIAAAKAKPRTVSVGSAGTATGTAVTNARDWELSSFLLRCYVPSSAPKEHRRPGGASR